MQLSYRADFASGYGCVDLGARHPVNLTWTPTPAPIQRHSMVSVRFEAAGREEKMRNDGSDTVEKVEERVGEQGNHVTWFSR